MRTIRLYKSTNLLARMLVQVIANAKASIAALLWLNVTASTALSVFFLLTSIGSGGGGGGFFISLFFLLLSALSYCYLQAVYPRIPFAAAVITVAAQPVKEHYLALLGVAAGALLMQATWGLVWVLAIGSIAGQREDMGEGNTESSNTGFSLSFLFAAILSLYWGIEVLKYTVACTVNGTVACWYFHPRHSVTVASSLFRSATYNFGSICVGALLLAVVQTAHTILSLLRNRREGSGSDRRRGGSNNVHILEYCALVVAEAILACLESVMVYFNKYAFCYVAGFGEDFFESGKQVVRLFAERY